MLKSQNVSEGIVSLPHKKYKTIFIFHKLLSFQNYSTFGPPQIGYISHVDANAFLTQLSYRWLLSLRYDFYLPSVKGALDWNRFPTGSIKYE